MSGSGVAHEAYCPLIVCESSTRMRNEGSGFAEIDDEVAAVLAFVISSATFLAAQDDETGRCPKVVCKLLVISNPCGLTYVGANPASLRSAAPSRGRGERMRLCDVRSRLWKAEVSGQKSEVQSLKSDVSQSPSLIPRAAARSWSGSRRSALWASPAFCFCVPTTGPFRRSCRRCDSGGNLRGQGFPCGGSGGRKR